MIEQSLSLKAECLSIVHFVNNSRSQDLNYKFILLIYMIFVVVELSIIDNFTDIRVLQDEHGGGILIVCDNCLRLNMTTSE